MTALEPGVLVLIRHGETRSNREEVFRGRLQIPLSPAGEEQARALGAHPAAKEVRAVVSSPLERALATARIAFPHLQPAADERLNNLDLGEWSGRSKAEIRSRQTGEWDRWIRDPHGIRFPGGESLADVHDRARRFLEWFRRTPSGPLAAVTHRSVIKCLLGVALGLEKDYYWKFHLDNGSLTRLVWQPDRGFTLTTLNDTRHLPHWVTEWY